MTSHTSKSQRQWVVELRRVAEPRFFPADVTSNLLLGAADEIERTEDIQDSTVTCQESLNHPVEQVWFRAGLLACREYMARFVESESPTIAASIRANWWPDLGKDYGPPRRIAFGELTEGEYGSAEFRCLGKAEISPTLEALPIAEQFLLRGAPETGVKFANVSCSQCGREFGPGDHGYSRCQDHPK